VLNLLTLAQAEGELRGKRILVTGHTGFTGSWISHWLMAIGVQVYGFSLEPETTPAMFRATGLEVTATGTFGDIRDMQALQDAFAEARPELVLHLAAQPLVRRSYAAPLHTFAVNAMGTANVLECARQSQDVLGVVCVTTDKVYKNNEWRWPYRENDPLGGKDPYSASKSAAEMIIQSYASSFGSDDRPGPRIAVARGGNIIGGGDWSEDRLIPDFVRSVVNGEPLTLRFAEATRPWQHVLALAHGYILLLAGLLSPNPEHYAQSWNLGPLEAEQFSVRAILELLSSEWKRPDLRFMKAPVPEAGALALDSTLAFNHLGWRPVWDTRESVRRTAQWYRGYYEKPSTAADMTREQINAWRGLAGR
jgi:CDP-glucose 4,6-dehydratase